MKFRLKDASGAYVSNAIARLYVAPVIDGTAGDEKEAVSAGKANTGKLFRYDGIENQYIFNLNTANLASGTWRLRIELDDGTSKYVNIVLEAKGHKSG